MADGGLRYFISYLLKLVRYDNGSASNAISAQISKTLAATLRQHFTINRQNINGNEKKYNEKNCFYIINLP